MNEKEERKLRNIIKEMIRLKIKPNFAALGREYGCDYRTAKARYTEEKNREQGIELKIEKSVKKLVTEKGIDKSYGARPLRRTIQNIVEDSLAEYILDGKIKAGEEVKIAAKDGKIIVK